MSEMIKMSFFDKELSEAFMTRTKLRNNFQQNKGKENKEVLWKTKQLLCLSFKKDQKEML